MFISIYSVRNTLAFPNIYPPTHPSICGPREAKRRNHWYANPFSCYSPVFLIWRIFLKKRFFNLQDNGIHYYDCNIRPTSINSKERNLDGKETRNLSKIWPLDLDFPVDFLKYWQSLEFLQSLELLCSGGSCGGFLNSKKCSVGLWGASFSGVT